MYSFQVIQFRATASIWVFGQASSKALIAHCKKNPQKFTPLRVYRISYPKVGIFLPFKWGKFFYHAELHPMVTKSASRGAIMVRDVHVYTHVTVACFSNLTKILVQVYLLLRCFQVSTSSTLQVSAFVLSLILLIYDLVHTCWILVFYTP